jgi:hypothetical protein
MGNSCTKELTLNTILGQSGANHASKYRKNDLVGSTMGGSNADNSLVKGSQVKFAIVHPQIRDILSRLSYEEIQILLV